MRPLLQADASDDLFEEVWKMTSKFYYDRNFGGNDWDKVGLPSPFCLHFDLVMR
jgi:hypothetical protein